MEEAPGRILSLPIEQSPTHCKARSFINIYNTTTPDLIYKSLFDPSEVLLQSRRRRDRVA